jgi:hypothetical protein
MEHDNEKRYQLLEDTIFEMEEHWGIPRGITATVLTAFIGKFRKTLRDGSYETLAQEFYDVVRDVRGSLASYREARVDERGTPFSETKVHRKRGRFCKAPSSLGLGT